MVAVGGNVHYKETVARARVLGGERCRLAHGKNVHAVNPDARHVVAARVVIYEVK